MGGGESLTSADGGRHGLWRLLAASQPGAELAQLGLSQRRVGCGERENRLSVREQTVGEDKLGGRENKLGKRIS